MDNTTRNSVDSFLRFKPGKFNNTQVNTWYSQEKDLKVSRLILCDNIIAELESEDKDTKLSLSITTAGCPTKGSCDRLNGIPGVQVYRIKENIYLNGVKWEDHHLLREVPFTWKSCFYCGHRINVVDQNKIMCELRGVQDYMFVCPKFKTRNLAKSK